jgi:adenosylmethionine-8-amino-7-oxononanoate aminotransferase
MEFVEYADETPRRVLGTYQYWVETDIGKLIDTMCGNSAYVWGYGHPQLNQAITSQLNQIQFLRAKNSETADIVLEVNNQLLEKSGMAGIIWAVSGSDGVEAGLELAYQYWNNIDNKKTKILSFVPGYHGCTFLGKSLYGGRYNENVVTFDAPFWNNDNDRTESELYVLNKLDNFLGLDQTIGTIIFETIPWINGIRPYSATWWQSLRAICDKHNVLMVADDVWGGFGKVGPEFSHTMFQIQPDIVIMGKSITGGYIPLSCALTNSKVKEVVNRPGWIHGHTWQPQMLGIALTNQVLKMFNYNQVEEIDQKQKNLLNKLELKYRGSGLTKEILFDKWISKKDIESAGLCNTQYTNNSLFLVTPFCADEEYWYELEKRITTLL